MAFKKHKFDLLVRTFHGDLYRYALFLSRNESLAQDLVQEVYLRAWKNLHKLRDVKAAKSWLFTILSRENARHFGRNKVDTVSIDFVEEIPSTESTEKNMQRHQLQRAIVKLDADYREPILLQIVGGFSTDEIAQILKLNDNTVSTRLFRARSQLKKAMRSDTSKAQSKGI
jgi:RNA polymerase sigma-70 factor (ECF subfamily)